MAGEISQQTQQQIQSLSPDAYSRIQTALNDLSRGRGLMAGRLHTQEEAEIYSKLAKEFQQGTTSSLQISQALGVSPVAREMTDKGLVEYYTKLPTQTPELITAVEQGYKQGPIQMSPPSNQDVMMGQTGSIPQSVLQRGTTTFPIPPIPQAAYVSPEPGYPALLAAASISKEVSTPTWQDTLIGQQYVENKYMNVYMTPTGDTFIGEEAARQPRVPTAYEETKVALGKVMTYPEEKLIRPSIKWLASREGAPPKLQQLPEAFKKIGFQRIPGLETKPLTKEQLQTAIDIGTFVNPWTGPVRIATTVSEIAGRGLQSEARVEGEYGLGAVPGAYVSYVKEHPIIAPLETAFVLGGIYAGVSKVRGFLGTAKIEKYVPAKSEVKAVEPFTRQRPTVILRTPEGGVVLGKTKAGEIISFGGVAKKGETAREAVSRELLEEAFGYKHGSIKGSEAILKLEKLGYKLKTAGKMVTPEETFKMFTATIKKVDIGKLVPKSDIAKIVYVPPWRVKLMETFAGQSALQPVSKVSLYPLGKIRAYESSMVRYLKTGEQPQWLAVETKAGKYLLGTQSRYDVPWNIAKEYESKTGLIAHGTTSPEILRKYSPWEKVMTISKTGQRGEKGLYIQPPSTSISGGKGYIGLSYLGYGPRKEILGIKIGRETPTAYLFKEKIVEPIIPTLKARLGKESERIIRVGTEISSKGTAQSAFLGGKTAYFQPAKIIKAGTGPGIGASSSYLGRYIYISPEQIIGSALSLKSSIPKSTIKPLSYIPSISKETPKVVSKEIIPYTTTSPSASYGYPSSKETYIPKEKPVVPYTPTPSPYTPPPYPRRGIPPYPPPLVPYTPTPPPKRFGGLEEKKKIKRIPIKKGYFVFTKKFGKPVLITPKPLVKGEALAFGVKYTKKTERASFNLVPSKMPVVKSGLKPLTEIEVFKMGYRYPIRKGKTGARDTFIQTMRTRMGTKAESFAIQSYKRRSGIW